MPLKTTAFLKEVLPTGTICLANIVPRKKDPSRSWVNHLPFDTPEDLAARALQDPKRNLFMAMGTLKQKWVPDPEREGKFKVDRTHLNIDKLRSFWIDIDFKEHPSPSAARSRIREFVDDLREREFPLPNIIVASGHGMHLYWVMDTDLERHVWQPYAGAFKRFVATHGAALKADLACTADSTRILRLPGTYNVKREPILCEVKYWDRRRTSFEKWKELLAAWASDNDPLEVSDLQIDPKVRELFKTTDNSDLGNVVDFIGKRTYSMEKVIESCPAYRRLIENGGAEQDYNAWIRTMAIFPHLEDGREWAHKCSAGHATYRREVVDRAFDEAKSKNEHGKLGPPLCATISEHCGDCASCPHLAAGGSPLHLGDVTPRAERPEPTFVKNGWTYRLIRGEDDETEQQLVYEGVLENFRLVDIADLGHHLLFTMRNGATVCEMSIPVEEIGKSQPSPSALRQGLILNGSNWKKVQQVFQSYQSLLQSKANAGQSTGFGWHEGDGNDGFAVAGELYRKGKPARPIGFVQPAISKIYEAQGDLAEWRRVLRVIDKEPRAEAHLLLCAPLAAPLSYFAPERPAALYVCSPQSGNGKTTYSEIGISIFAHPKQGLYKGNDTAHSLRTSMTTATDMPFYIDDVRGDEASRGVRDLFFDSIQGQDRRRLTRSAQVRTANEIRRLTVLSSNGSFTTFLESDGFREDSTAAFYRVWEVDFPEIPASMVKHSDRFVEIKHALRKHYGLAGREAAQYMAERPDEMRQRVVDKIKLLQTKLVMSTTERFWISLLAPMLVSAELTRDVVGLPVKPELVWKSIETNLRRLRGESQTTQAVQNDNVADLLRWGFDRVKVVKKDGAVQMPNRDATMLLDYNADIFYVPMSEVREYSRRTGRPLNQLKRQLADLSIDGAVLRDQIPHNLGTTHHYRVKAQSNLGTFDRSVSS